VLKVLALLLFTYPLRSQIPPIFAVSAATYQSTLAPDSVGSVFGEDLAHDTLTATVDAGGQLPTELAGVRVEVAGQLAALLYISPGQINFVVPASVAAGATTVAVHSVDTNLTRTAAVNIATTAPGLFTADSTGSGPGAILNAVTLAGGPHFSVTTLDGTTTRTRLVAFGTGFRHAIRVAAQGTLVTGEQFDLIVERIGAGSDNVGVDSIVFIVPPALDGAGTVSLTISTEDGTSNTVTFQMDLLPADLVQLFGLALVPAIVTGGENLTAALELTGVARAGGFRLALRSTNLAAQAPPVVFVPEGQASLKVPIPTFVVSLVQTGTVVAQSGAAVLNADFEVDPPLFTQLGGISVAPGTTLGGRTLEGTISLNSAAPAVGITVMIASNDLAVRPPAAVVIPFHQTAVRFSVPTTPVDTPRLATLVASLNGATVSTTVTLLPLISLSLDATTVTGGATVTATIRLADPAPPGGATIALFTTDLAATSVPPLVKINASQTTAILPIPTAVVFLGRTVTISAIYLGVKQSVILTINPPPPLALSSLVISPNQIPGGQSTQATITLTAPAPNGGFVVTLQSSSLLAARVPGFVVVPAGQVSLFLPIQTTKVPVAQTVTITATANGVVRTATLIVQ
jgi:uncharacterized protein (TIGR03437 family)